MGVDRYADRHNISQGLYDQALAAQHPTDPYAGNVPYKIAGLPVADRYSFYFPSKCFIRAPGRKGRRFRSENMRATGCRRVRKRIGRWRGRRTTDRYGSAGASHRRF